MQILLNDSCSPRWLSVLHNQRLNFRQTISNFYSAASIRIFSWFDDPDVWMMLLFFQLVKFLYELCETWIIHWLNMIGQGYSDLKRIQAQFLIVQMQIQKQSFLIAQVEIVLQSTVDPRMLLLELFQLVCEICLTPAGPYEIDSLEIRIRNKFFYSSCLMPPIASPHHLPNDLMVIPKTNVESWLLTFTFACWTTTKQFFIQLLCASLVNTLLKLEWL